MTLFLGLVALCDASIDSIIGKVVGSVGNSKKAKAAPRISLSSI